MTIHSDIDTIFNKGLSDYSEKVPSFIWDNIEQELIKKRKQTRRLSYYAIAASVALLLSFGAGYLFTNNKNLEQFAEVQKEIVNTQLEQEPKGNEPIKKNNSTTIPEEKSNTIGNNKKENIPVKNSKGNSESEKNNTIKTKPSPKVKKVNSSGTLLPPMYATQSNYKPQTSSNEHQTTRNVNEHEVSLINITSKKALLNIPEFEKDLVYEIRELPLPPLENEEINTIKNYNNWAVGFSGTPLLSYRHVQSSNSDVLYSSVNTSSLEQNYNNEKPLVSYSAGINVNYNLSNRWAIQSGFYYSETGQIIEDIYFDQNPAAINPNSNSEFLINTSAGNIVIGNSLELIASQAPRADNTEFSYDNTVSQGGSIATSTNSSNTSADFVQTLEYYELPLIINYKMIDRKLDVKLSGGFSANFLSANTTYLQNNGNRQNIDAELSGIKNTTYGSIIGIGLEYPLISQLLLNLSPTFRYSISAINSSGNTHPYSFGVYTGLKYSF